MANYDVALHKITKFAESTTLEIRFETFNAFNPAQFFGASSVDGIDNHRRTKCGANCSFHGGARRTLYAFDRQLALFE